MISSVFCSLLCIWVSIGYYFTSAGATFFSFLNMFAGNKFSYLFVHFLIYFVNLTLSLFGCDSWRMFYRISCVMNSGWTVLFVCSNTLSFLLDLLGWHWLIKIYRFWVHSSIIHHLYIIFCVHCPKSSLLPSPFIPPLPSFPSPHPLSLW